MWLDSAFVESFRDMFPEWMALVFAFISFFGSVYFVAPVIVIMYWWADRYQFIHWVSIIIGCYAIMIASKSVISYPRPDVGPAISPEALPYGIRHFYEALLIIDTTSFPSGHAFAAVVIWTMLALETDVGTRFQRSIVAVVMVLLVGIARVGGGIHYPLDVIAGIGLGVGYIALAIPVTSYLKSRDPNRAPHLTLASAGILSGIAALIDGQVDTLALFGGAIGTFIAWSVFSPPQHPWPRSLLPVVYVAVGLSVLLAGVLTALLFQIYAFWLVIGIIGGLITIGLPSIYGGDTEIKSWKTGKR